MNDAWEHALLVEPATPISANPWRDPNSSSNTLQSARSDPHSFLIPPITATRGRSTSIAAGGATGSLAINNAGSTTASNITPGAEQVFSSSLRPRARLRRLRSDLALSDQDAADTLNEQTHALTSRTPARSSDTLGYTAANGSAASLGAPRGLDMTTPAHSSSSRSITPSTSSHIRRKTSGESHPAQPMSSSSDFDWDEDDKTREGKARKQGKSTRRTALPSPFSFTLGSGFGSKLWGDVETLWNETLSPSAGYNHKTSAEHGVHAYLDVWGRPVTTLPFEEPEDSRGRDRSVGGQRRAGARNRGPLVEREDVSTSTTPALSRKTTDTFKERNRSRNLISGEGINILDSESLLANKNADITAEAEVFEHVVGPADSLEGVALKYGVTVAQLRKCNKMWASDTIHLRKVLYIPVTSIGTLSKKSSTSHVVSGELIDLTTNISQASLTADGDGDPYDLQTPTSTHPRGSSYSSPSSKSTSYISSPSASAYNRTLSESTSTVSSLNPSKSTASTPSTKRIPISELSYFPPPSTPSTTIFTSNPHPSTMSAAMARKWELQNGVSSSLFASGPASTSIPASSSLTADSQPSSRTASPARNNTGLASSIFQAFPSLNDITSRVSFETVRSTGSLPGSGNVSGEEDMELDEMKQWNGAAVSGVSIGAGVGSLPSRGVRKRAKVRPKGSGTDSSPPVAGDEGKGKGKVITQQLTPLKMELPNVQAISSNGGVSRRDGSYGSGWMDPDAA